MMWTMLYKHMNAVRTSSPLLALGSGSACLALAWGRKSAREDHAFLVKSMPGGNSERLDCLKVDEQTTFRRLRRLIEARTKTSLQAE